VEARRPGSCTVQASSGSDHPARERGQFIGRQVAAHLGLEHPVHDAAEHDARVIIRPEAVDVLRSAPAAPALVIGLRPRSALPATAAEIVGRGA